MYLNAQVFGSYLYDVFWRSWLQLMFLILDVLGILLWVVPSWRNSIEYVTGNEATGFIVLFVSFAVANFFVYQRFKMAELEPGTIVMELFDLDWSNSGTAPTGTIETAMLILNIKRHNSGSEPARLTDIQAKPTLNTNIFKMQKYSETWMGQSKGYGWERPTLAFNIITEPKTSDVITARIIFTYNHTMADQLAEQLCKATRTKSSIRIAYKYDVTNRGSEERDFSMPLDFHMLRDKTCAFWQERVQDADKLIAVARCVN